MIIVPFSSDQDEWNTLEGIDVHNKFRNGMHKHYILDDFRPCTYAGMIQIPNPTNRNVTAERKSYSFVITAPPKRDPHNKHEPK